jgi:hypothetical protein
MNGLWLVREDLKIQSKPTAKQTAGFTDILRILDGSEFSVGEWQSLCKASKDIAPRTFDDRKKEAREFIDERKVGKETRCKLTKARCLF